MRKPLVKLQYETIMPPFGYSEKGSDSGAKLDSTIISNPDLIRIFHETKNLDTNGTMRWISDNRDTLDDSTIVINTSDADVLRKLHALEPEMIIQQMPLNKIRHLNTMLNSANEILAQNGYLWCHARTSAVQQRIIHQQWPGLKGRVIYDLYYFWHRFCAKMPGIRSVYMAITKGEHRSYSRTEILGRFYRAGFEVIDENFRRGEFFVLGRKSKAPIWDDEPSCGPMIKLPRIGKGGEMIGVYKLRTMYSYSEYLQPYVYEHEGLQDGGKFTDDYRVTNWGKKLRQTWFDEIPMFINLLKGQLKLVGVRPLSRHYFSLYTPEMQELRIKVKPGLFPPFYYEKKTPVTIEEVQESERRYIESYLKAPFATDWRYFWGSIRNIVFKHKRSN